MDSTHNIDISTNNVILNQEKNDKCFDLDTIKYKSKKMCRNNKSQNCVIPTQNTHETNVNEILNNNIQNKSTNEYKPWNKLSKNEKKKALKQFAKEQDNKQLANFLLRCLDRHKLTKNTEVIYDIETGKITKIPNLTYYSSKKMFSLRNKEKKDSTLKNLSKLRKKK